MNINKVSAGKSIPDDLYAVIEISANSDPIKYEINKRNGLLYVDRIIPTAMFYPCNYGFINKTLSDDGDPIDVLLLSPYPLLPGTIARCRPVGMLKMTDEAGSDNKIITVLHRNITDMYNNIHDIEDINDTVLSKIAHFFKHYKNLEQKKWVKINGWFDAEISKKEILDAFERNRYKE